MKRPLLENFSCQVMLEPNLQVTTDNMLSEWGAVPCAQLSVILVHLRYVSFVHQTHHWTCKGDSFYGDHKLFEDLYEGTLEDIDGLAEKAIGLGSEGCVNLQLHVKQLAQLVSQYGSSMTIPHAAELSRRSLLAEVNFLKVASLMVASMKEMGTMTRGLDNLLAGIEDRHEANVYHLKQKCGQ